MFGKILLTVTLLAAPVVASHPDYCSPGMQWYVYPGLYTCPDGSVMPYSCSSACAADLKETMDGYVSQACFAQGNINDTYDAQEEEALEDYDDCLLGGGNPQDCLNAYNNAMTSIAADREQALTNLDNAFNAAKAAAQSNFENCLANCCE